MALTYGFFNSLKGDRKYNAEQVSELFDGILKDGIIPSQGQLFAVTTANNGMQINVGTGRAWFDHTWTKNDSVKVLTVPQSDITRDRWDAVVLEVNHSEDVRANDIKIVSGTAAVNPVKPAMVSTDKVHQYPLAYIRVPAAAETILAENIENAVGLEPTVFATGILETVPLNDLWEQWKGEWHTWFSAIKLQLSGDIVTNLQLQIEERVKVVDKASTAEALDGTSDTKWMTPAKVKAVVEGNELVNVGGEKLKLGMNKLLAPTNVSLYAPSTSIVNSAKSYLCGNYILWMKVAFDYNNNKQVTDTIYAIDLTTGETFTAYTVTEVTTAPSSSYQSYVALHNCLIAPLPTSPNNQFLALINKKVCVLKITVNKTTGIPTISRVKTYSNFTYEDQNYDITGWMRFGKDYFAIGSRSSYQWACAAYTGNAFSTRTFNTSSTAMASGNYLISMGYTSATTISVMYLNMETGDSGSQSYTVTSSEYINEGPIYWVYDRIYDIMLCITRQDYLTKKINVHFFSGNTFKRVEQLTVPDGYYSFSVADHLESIHAILGSTGILIIYNKNGIAEIRYAPTDLWKPETTRSSTLLDNYITRSFPDGTYLICDLNFSPHATLMCERSFSVMITGKIGNNTIILFDSTTSNANTHLYTYNLKSLDVYAEVT